MILSRVFDYTGMIESYLHSSTIKEYLKQKPRSESFYQIISKSDKLWLLNEEKFLKKQYGIQRLQKGIFNKIKQAKPGMIKINKVPFYDILAN